MIGVILYFVEGFVKDVKFVVRVSVVVVMLSCRCLRIIVKIFRVLD